HWADKLLPQKLKPYARLARLDRPIGWWLLLLPGWWAIALAVLRAGGGAPDLRLLALFFAGAIIMRGAGCTLNDIVDRDFDAKVARTRLRPLPSGAVSVRGAVVFLLLLLVAGLAVLVQLNAAAIALGAASLALVAIYPFMKRWTYWPQLVLGLAFNWGALMGFAAVEGRLSAAAGSLYAGGVFWTLAYDTIYAHQDKEDDALIGVKSSALILGSATVPWVAGFFFISLVLIDLAGVLVGAGAIFHFGVVAAALHAAWQLSRLTVDDPDSCLRIFRSNRDFGLIIFAGATIASLAQGASVP
ncbi:MAG: 4-hydroxybenzoate octaprenyltransferase, partial [Aestuariivirgaceae bacterium]